MFDELKQEYRKLKKELLDYENRQLIKMRNVVIKLNAGESKYKITYASPAQVIDISNATLDELNRVFGDITRGTGV